MRVGIEAFVGDRLRDALSIRDETAKDVAVDVGITAESMSRYVRGTSRPEPLILRALAERLRLPEAYFVRPAFELLGSPLFFRSLVAATKRARAGAAVRYGWLRETWSYLHQYVEFPSVKFPNIHVPPDPEAIDNTEVEVIAREAREKFGVGRGPIANMVRLLEHNGGIVARVNLGSSRLDAFCQWAMPEDRPFFVLNSDKRSAARSRWDAAHELGHAILHRHVDPKLLNRPDVFKRAEQQAHRFAGAFLLPADTFGRNVYVPTLSVLESQKRIWGVSIAAMLRRLVQLRLVQADHATRIWRSYSRQGLRLREPLDDDVPAEQPEVLRKAYEMMVKERAITKQQLLTSLPFDAAEMQALLGLSISFNKETSPDIQLRANVPERPVSEARVLQWRTLS